MQICSNRFTTSPENHMPMPMSFRQEEQKFSPHRTLDIHHAIQ